VRHALGPVLQVVLRPLLKLLLTHGGAEVVDLAFVQRFVLCLGGSTSIPHTGSTAMTKLSNLVNNYFQRRKKQLYTRAEKGPMCAPPKKVEEKKKEEKKK
jgi:hypothetical protein